MICNVAKYRLIRAILPNDVAILSALLPDNFLRPCLLGEMAGQDKEKIGKAVQILQNNTLHRAEVV